MTLTPAQSDVLSVLAKRGPLDDATTAALVHHTCPTRQASSGVRTRRVELQRAGFVTETPERVRMASGRSARVFAITPEGRAEVTS